MLYTNKVIKHFKNPHNQGVIKKADAIGQAGNPVCGDVMKMYLKIKKQENKKARKQKSPIDKGPACYRKRPARFALRSKAGGSFAGRGGGDVIEDIKFETLGCAAAIAVSSALTDIAKGKTLDEAMKIKKEDIVNNLGGLPPVRIHCSMLGLEALHKAIKEFMFKSKKINVIARSSPRATKQSRRTSH